MGYKIPFLVVLGITFRTCVTNRIVLPRLNMSAVEMPLFSTAFPTLVLLRMGYRKIVRHRSHSRSRSDLTLDSVRIALSDGKGQRFHRLGEYALGIEGERPFPLPFFEQPRGKPYGRTIRNSGSQLRPCPAAPWRIRPLLWAIYFSGTGRGYCEHTRPATAANHAGAFLPRRGRGRLPLCRG